MKKITTKLLFLSFILTFILNASTGSNDFNFDLRKLPFSHFGAYTSLMIKTYPETGENGLFLQDISGRYLWHWKGIYKIEPTMDGKPLDYELSATPGKITMITDQGTIEITYQSADIIRMKSNHIGIKLTQTVKDGASNTFPVTEDKTLWRCQMGGYDHYALSVISGNIKIQTEKTVAGEKLPDNPIAIIDLSPDKTENCEIALEQYQDSFDRQDFDISFEKCVNNRLDAIDDFSKHLLPVPDTFKSLAAKTKYLKWSSFVKPKGNIQRTSMYMSKNWMNGIWGWDNCFDALGYSYHNIDKALDLILVMFDHQSKKGGIPDLITDQHTMWGAFKPPIQGLTMMKMMAYNQQELTLAQLQKVYQPLVDYTNFWFEYMDDNNNGLPQYNHANDSGEDNCSVFEVGYPAEAPDLCTYLILQMDFLAYAANRLNKPDEAAGWQQKSDNLLKLMIDELWMKDQFVTKNSLTGEYNQKSHAFLNYTPILLGEKLPSEIRHQLIKILKAPNSIVTPYGPASEHPDSPYFKEDGYWRGAVWAPQYFFLVEGLKRCGEEEWAQELAIIYCKMCEKAGFPENFSALDGGPLKDSGYSWTSSVFLMLAYEYLK
ncbi:MAG: amylo-alpha-1,6-glucosidase [Fidelibacterota bacterium]